MRHALKLLTGLVVILALGGCSQTTPEQQVQEARASYTARLSSFVVKQTPLAEPEPPEAIDEEGMADAGIVGADEADLVGEEPVEVATRSDVLFDIIIGHEGGTKKLDQLTLDITQADPSETTKKTWLHTVDISDLLSSKQVSYTVEGVDYEDGDLFHIGIRANIPPEERAGYPEFAEAGSSAP